MAGMGDLTGLLTERVNEEMARQAIAAGLTLADLARMRVVVEVEETGDAALYGDTIALVATVSLAPAPVAPDALDGKRPDRVIMDEVATHTEES